MGKSESNRPEAATVTAYTDPADPPLGEDGEPATHWNHLRTIMLISAVCSLYFCQVLLMVGTGALGRSMAAVVGGTSLTAWPPMVFTIMTSALCPPIAQAADYWGRKSLLVGLSIFGFVGSMIIARASSFNMIIGGCVVAGIAFGTQALFVAVSSEVLPRKYRTWGQAGANTAVALGAIFSLCVAGYLTRRDPNGFRTYFYITAGIYAFSTISCGLLYISPPRELERVYNTRQKLAQLDWPGYIMITSGAVLFCTGLSWAQNPYPWSDAHVLAPFLLGTFILIALCLYSWKIRKDGLLHHDMFRNRNLAISLTAVFIEGLAFMAANVYFSYAVAVLHGDTMGPFDQTLCLMVAFVAFWVAAVVAAYWIYLTKEIRIPGVTTFVMFLIFFIVMSTISPSTPKANFWGYSLFYGTGMGLCLTTFVTAAQFAAPPELIAVTSGLTLSIRALGGGLGLAIFNAIFAHGLSSNLVPKITSAVTKLGLSSESAAELVAGLTAGNAAAVAAIPGVTDAIVAAAALAFKQAYIIAFRYVYVCGGAFSIVGCISSAFLINPKAEFTAKIDAPIEVYGEYDVESKLASVDEARVEHVEAARNTGS